MVRDSLASGDMNTILYSGMFSGNSTEKYLNIVN